MLGMIWLTNPRNMSDIMVKYQTLPFVLWLSFQDQAAPDFVCCLCSVNKNMCICICVIIKDGTDSSKTWDKNIYLHLIRSDLEPTMTSNVNHLTADKCDSQHEFEIQAMSIGDIRTYFNCVIMLLCLCFILPAIGGAGSPHCVCFTFIVFTIYTAIFTDL